MRSARPALLKPDIVKERLALEEAIRKVEAEAARKSPTETLAASPAAGAPDGGAHAASGRSRTPANKENRPNFQAGGYSPLNEAKFRFCRNTTFTRIRFSISFAHSSQSNGGLVFVASYAEFLERTRVPFSTTEIKNLDNVPIANPINMLRRYGSRKLLMGM